MIGVFIILTLSQRLCTVELGGSHTSVVHHEEDKDCDAGQDADNDARDGSSRE